MPRRTAALLAVTGLALAVPGVASGDTGSLDTAYGKAGIAALPMAAGAGDRFLAAATGPGDLTYAAGYVTVAGTDQAMAVARVRPDGSFDPSFSGDGWAAVNAAGGRGTAEAARGVGVQSNGKVVVGGSAESTAPGAHSSDTDIVVARFATDGSLDPTFGTNGVATLNLSPGALVTPTGTAYRGDTSWGVLVLGDDKIFLTAARGPDGVGGRVDTDFAFVRLTKDGALDPTFGSGGVTVVNTTAVANGVTENLVDSPRQAVVQPDGKVVVGSYASGSAAVGTAVRLVRLLPNGTLDATFGSGGIATAPVLGPSSNLAEVYDIGLQGDRFVVAGYGRTGSTGAVDLYAARFRADGTWDTSFGTNGATRVDLAGEDDRARDLVVLPDGRTLVVGSGKLSASDIDAMAVMLTADGRLDTSFDDDGISLVDLGGPGDSFFGVSSTAKGAFVAGYSGRTPASGDDAAAARVLLTPSFSGYRLVAADGGVFAYGSSFLGSMGGLRLNAPIVGAAATPSGNGYWLVASDGGVFAFGDAAFHGSAGGARLARPVVGMAPTPSGKGYWLVAADGGVFAYGDAAFAGSTGASRLNSPIVGIAAGRTARGYRLVASDGGVFAFGDAAFHGSTGGARLARPVVGMAATPSDRGYWLVGADGGVFAFGDAGFQGSTGALRLARPVVGLVATPSGSGYRLVAADGGVFTFGDARFLGSAGGTALAFPVVGVAAK